MERVDVAFGLHGSSFRTIGCDDDHCDRICHKQTTELERFHCSLWRRTSLCRCFVAAGASPTRRPQSRCICRPKNMNAPSFGGACFARFSKPERDRMTVGSAESRLSARPADRSSDVPLAPAVRAAAIVAAGSAAMLIGAYIFQYVLKIPPCPLCLEQRIPHYIAVPLAAIVAAAAAKGAPRTLVAVGLAALVIDAADDRRASASTIPASSGNGGRARPIARARSQASAPRVGVCSGRCRRRWWCAATKCCGASRACRSPATML